MPNQHLMRYNKLLDKHYSEEKNLFDLVCSLISKIPDFRLSPPISSALTRNWGLKLKPESFEIPAFQFKQMKHYSVFLIVPVI